MVPAVVVFMLNLPKMEVKKILDKIRQPKEAKKEYFFALQIGIELVKSAIWTIETGLVKILSIGKVVSWHGEDEFLEAVDASLTSTIKKFTSAEEAEEPNKIILGLPRSWIKEDKIIPEKLEVLKKLSQKLELVPTGFVITIEAIAHHLKSLEGIPPTAILVGLRQKKIAVSLINLGKIMGVQLIERSGDLGADLAEGLSRLQQAGPFPSRILLYDSDENLEEARQELVDYSWPEGVSFLHLPKVEILAVDFDIKAVALAGGKEVVQAKGIESLSSEETEEAKPESVTEIMGFVKEKDVGRERRLTVPKIKVNLGPILNFFSHRTSLVLALIASFLLVVGGILIAAWWYLPKAEVVLLIEPQILEKDFTISLDSSLAVADKDKLILPATVVVETLEAQETMVTTGTKLTGEPATGKVIAYNATSQEKTFKRGTVITSVSNVGFTIDENATVASQSGTASDSIPGKAEVSVTAVEIGTEGNLAAGTQFTIGNYSKSDYEAKNESAFSGGTSREVQVVSKKDQEKLVEELMAEIEKRALVQLQASVTANQKLVEESLTKEIAKKSFDKNVDEEAVELSLNLRLKFSALSFNEEEFKSLIEEEIQKAVPEGFEYRAEESETNFSSEKVEKEGTTVFSVHFKANLLPLLDLEGIKKNLAGKHPIIGKAYLESLPHVDSFDTKMNFTFPSKLATFPRIVKNIKIEVKVK